MPGLGQWYNGQKLKALLVFGGSLGLVGNGIYYNNMAIGSSEDDERDFYLGLRSRAFWLLGLLYLLNLLDAYVDAELFDFDAGTDLSFHSPEAGHAGLRAALSIPLNSPGASRPMRPFTH